MVFFSRKSQPFQHIDLGQWHFDKVNIQFPQKFVVRRGSALMFLYLVFFLRKMFIPANYFLHVSDQKNNNKHNRTLTFCAMFLFFKVIEFMFWNHTICKKWLKAIENDRINMRKSWPWKPWTLNTARPKLPNNVTNRRAVVIQVKKSNYFYSTTHTMVIHCFKTL